MNVKKDQLTGLALALLGVVVAWQVSGFKKPLTAEYPGPRLFPLIAVFGLIVCGLGIFFQSTFSKKAEAVFLTKAGWAKAGATFAVLAVYVFAMKYLGYLIVTPFALFAISTLFAKGGGVKAKLIPRIVFSIAFSVLLYVVYVHVFGMSLPGGELLS